MKYLGIELLVKTANRVKIHSIAIAEEEEDETRLKGNLDDLSLRKQYF